MYPFHVVGMGQAETSYIHFETLRTYYIKTKLDVCLVLPS